MMMEYLLIRDLVDKYLKQKLDYLFIITASKLPKFEFWRTFSLVVATVSKQKKLQRPVKKGAKIQT